MSVSVFVGKLFFKGYLDFNIVFLFRFVGDVRWVDSLFGGWGVRLLCFLFLVYRY